jgi:hypothetical protein
MSKPVAVAETENNLCLMAFPTVGFNYATLFHGRKDVVEIIILRRRERKPLRLRAGFYLSLLVNAAQIVRGNLQPLSNHLP